MPQIILSKGAPLIKYEAIHYIQIHTQPIYARPEIKPISRRYSGFALTEELLP